MGTLPLIVVLAAQVATPIRVVVNDIETDLPVRATRIFEGSLLKEIGKLDGVVAMTMADARGTEEAADYASDNTCPAKRDCLAGFAAALDAHTLMMVRITTMGNTRVLSIKRLELRSGVVVQAATRRLRVAGGQEMLLALGGVMEQLFPDRPLREGAERGPSMQVVERIDPPPLPIWAFFVSIGVTGAAAAAMTISYLLQVSTVNSYNDLANSGGVVSGAHLVALSEEARTYNNLGHGMLAVTATFAVYTVIAFFFTDWQGDEVIAPMLRTGGDGAAVGLVGRF